MKKNQLVPADFADVLRKMRDGDDPRLSATLWTARGWGWTLVALGNALGITREAVRQRIDVKPFKQYPTDQLPPIPLPPRRPTPMPAHRPRLTVPPDLADELRAMYAVAKTVNGAVPVDDLRRRVSEDLTVKLADLVAQGVTQYHIAQVLGVTPATVGHRLARHGYRDSSPSQAHNAYRNKQHTYERKERAA